MEINSKETSSSRKYKTSENDNKFCFQNPTHKIIAKMSQSQQIAIEMEKKSIQLQEKPPQSSTTIFKKNIN